MTGKDRPAFAACLAVCAETFAEAMSEARLEAYFRALSDLTLDDVEAGVAVAIRTARFFPKPAELREAVHGAPEDDAEAGWLALLEAARRGYWDDPVFADGSVAEAITAVFGTWILCVDAFCDLSEPAWQAKRKEFLAAYRVMRRRGADRTPKSLTGMCSLQNALNGWTPERVAALKGTAEPRALTEGTEQ